MVRWSHLTALSLIICITTRSTAVETYDLIPADAMAGVSCKSIQGLVQKSEKLIKDAEIKLPVQPRALCKELFMALGIQVGLDTKGGCSAVLVNEKHIGEKFKINLFGGGGSNAEKFVVLTIPMSDIDDMAGNFGIGKGKLKPETMTTLEMPAGGFLKKCYVKGKYIYFGNVEKAMLSVVNGKTVGAELSAERRKALADSDCLCQLGVESWGDEWKKGIADAPDYLGSFKDEAEKKTVKELIESLATVRYVFAACKLDGGFGCSCVCVFPKEGQAQKLLTALRGGDGGSSLEGLPEGNVVAATAARGDGTKNRHIARVLINLLHGTALVPSHIFGEADRPAILAVFDEIWPRLQGSRFALYKTADERRMGLFSAVGILDVEDGEKFIAHLKTLAKLGSAEGLDFTSEAGKEKTVAEIEELVKDLGARRFQARESATAKLLLAGDQVLPYLEKALKSTDLETSRRAERIKREIVQAAEDRRKELLSGNLTRAVKPSFVFLDQMEKIEGFEVYNVGVKLKKADAATGPHLRQLLGPDWARVRIGVQGKQVVLLAGSDVKLLGEALRNLKEKRPGLASSAALGDQAKRIEPGRKIELHVSVAMGIVLATAADLEKPGKVAANPPLTTVALIVEEDRLQCDLWLPVQEIKVIAKQAQPPE